MTDIMAEQIYRSAASRIRLGVNVDHVATVRQARRSVAPSPVAVAITALAAGADSITMHLREDRRHIADGDVREFVTNVGAKLNFEMAATEEMLSIALEVKPYAVCIVPEQREELTTESGLNLVAHQERMRPMFDRIRDAGIRLGVFLDSDERQIEAAAQLGCDAIELHVGEYCDLDLQLEASNASDVELKEQQSKLFQRLETGAAATTDLQMEAHAGHGMTYSSARKLAAITQFSEFNIGHFLVGEAISIGMTAAVARMLVAMNEGRA